MQKILSEIKSGALKPFYLVVGEEPFQGHLIREALEKAVLQSESDRTMNFQCFDSEGLDGGDLLQALDVMPGLFDGPDTQRLIICTRFERLKPTSLEVLSDYFKEPNPSTIFLMLASKVDKRKAWVRQVGQKGAVAEVAEPYDRDWPRWKPFMEGRLGKKIDAAGWECLLESSGRNLSVVWSEMEKLGVFVGNASKIKVEDVQAVAAGMDNANVFNFVEDVLCGRRFESMQKFQTLTKGGESEVKVLALLVRQFRLVEGCLKWVRQGITDAKILGPRLGVHPFFVPRIIQQAKKHDEASLNEGIHLLAHCDYAMKTSDVGLFDGFLAPYFAAMHR